MRGEHFSWLPFLSEHLYQKKLERTMLSSSLRVGAVPGVLYAVPNTKIKPMFVKTRDKGVWVYSLPLNAHFAESGPQSLHRRPHLLR